VSKASGRDERI